MANYKVIEVEGIGPTYSEKLNKAGIRTTDELLAACKTKANREKVAEESGIEYKRILRFANMVDLFRISGVGSEYADLLEAAGVDTVKELAMRNPENLTQRMQEVNEQRHLVRSVPTLVSVTKWVEEAKTLPRMLFY